MAEEPKKDDKAAGGIISSSEAFTQIAMIGLIVLFVMGVYKRFFGNGADSFLNSAFMQGVDRALVGFKVVSVLFALVCAAAIASLVQRINAIRAEERKALYPEQTQADSQGEVINFKWQRVVDHLESDNLSDWKLAIIEADIILNEMLDRMGYHGETVGEKLKQVEKSDFLTIEKAWEAHKIRNLIAHEGADFVLTKKEAVRVIELYKDVFEEFFFI
jgi:hypothetical protein